MSEPISTGTNLTVPRLSLSSCQRRKLSFPAALLGAEGPNSAAGLARRRFSNVGDAVSRKLSHTIGWRSVTTIPVQDVVEQSKALCCRYIRSRLKRSGYTTKKLGLCRLGSGLLSSSSAAAVVSEVYPGVAAAGVLLEQSHPRLFSNVSRQASSTPAGALLSDNSAATLLANVGREILRHDVSWGKLVALFCVAGGLAVDCACQGKAQQVHAIADAVAEIVEDDAAEWLASNGGWPALVAQCRRPDNDPVLLLHNNCLVAVVTAVLAVVAMFVLVRCFLRLY